MTLPWGGKIYVDPNDSLGKSLLHMGIYDLALTECLFRILKSGVGFLDIGANIGYASGIAASLLPSQSPIYSFEPNPPIIGRLKKNIDLWNHPIQLIDKALSDQSGVLTLYLPLHFESNRGTATLEKNKFKEFTSFEVETVIFDDWFKNLSSNNSQEWIGKFDVEGHEANIFRGMSCFLESKKMKTIIFEDYDYSNSQSVEILKSHGYKILKLSKGIFGPKLLIPNSSHLKQSSWEPPNFIATLEEDYIQSLFQSKGWRCLR